MTEDPLTFESESEAAAAAKAKNQELGLSHGEFAGGYWEAVQQSGVWAVVFRSRPVTWRKRASDFFQEAFFRS